MYNNYRGSLTTPPCSEKVIWTVFENTIKISKKQVKLLKSIFDFKNKFMLYREMLLNSLQNQIFFV